MKAASASLLYLAWQMELGFQKCPSFQLKLILNNLHETNVIKEMDGSFTPCWMTKMECSSR